jgi:putative endonuclease
MLFIQNFIINFATKTKENHFMALHNELGKWGEDVAASYLERLGYTILERDWKSGHRDLDIIAREGDIVVFVEVKTRRNRDFTDPEMAVDYQKIRHLQQAANHYIKFRHIDNDIRFDIITVVGTMNETPSIEHIKDAF